MKQMVGRNIYVVSLANIMSKQGLETFIARGSNASFSAIWIRLGRGPTIDANLAHPLLPELRARLKASGVELWGWHVPFCADLAATRAEVANVLEWTQQGEFEGVVCDAERTPENPRFRGGSAEAELYSGLLREGLAAANKAIAFSSHDQPARHTGLPFESFLKIIDDVCPQMYYRTIDVATRFNRSVNDYRALIPPHAFARRFKPTGNITTSDDLPFASPALAIDATTRFMKLVREGGHSAYSFWCWDAAPDEIWEFFKKTPV